ncbi:MAG: nitrile hydratase subunit beta [Pseudomonadota bacterium]
MTRPHDMGGRFGDGAVIPEAEGVLFKQDWHRRALALTLAGGTLGLWNLDISRHAREKLAPTDYARFAYYEKWISALADLLVETGALSAEELATGRAAGPATVDVNVLRAADVAGVLARGGPANRDSGPVAKFKPGDRVQVRARAENVTVDGGHTRLPAYLAGATGIIQRHHGTHVLPDSNAHRLGEAPEPLYAVAFAAGDLWAHPEHAGDQVVADLWQSYLSPA